MTDAERLAEYLAFREEFGTGEAEWADTSPEGVAYWRATHPLAPQSWSTPGVVTSTKLWVTESVTTPLTEILAGAAGTTFRLLVGTGLTRRQLETASL